MATRVPAVTRAPIGPGSGADRAGTRAGTGVRAGVPGAVL